MATVAVALLIGLAQFNLDAANRGPTLGVRAERRGDQLVVTWVQPAGPTWDAGVRPGDVVVAVDGRLITPNDSPALVDGASTVQVLSASRSALRVVNEPSPVLSSEWHRLSFLVIAAAFAAVGCIVYILATNVVSANALLASSLAASVMLIAAIGTTVGAGWAIAVEYVSFVCFAATTFVFFLVFPVDRLQTRVGRWALAVCVGITAILVVLYLWMVIWAPAAYDLLQRLAFAAVAAGLLGATVLAWRTSRWAAREQPETRRALRLVTVGVLAGLTPFGLLSLGPYLLGLGYILPPDVAILSLVLVPVSQGAAVLSRQFLGIDRVVRRGMVALFAWIAVLGVYSIVLEALRRGLLTPEALDPVVTALLGSSVLVVAVIGSTFWPLLDRLRRAVEQRLFRDVYSYPQTLWHMSREIAERASVEELAEYVVLRLSGTLDLTWSAVALRDGPYSGNGATAIVRRQGACPSWLDAPALMSAAETAARNAPGTATIVGHAYVVPLVVDGLVIGALAAGQKKHDVDLLPEDRALLATLAPLLAVASQNAMLVRQLEEQLETLRERERELATLSAQLINAQEEERRRLALDLHDEPIQWAILLAREMDSRLDDPGVREYRASLQDIVDSLRATCAALRLPALNDFGLVAALEWLVEDVQVRSDVTAELVVEATGLNGTSGAEAFGRLNPNLELALYRVAQEALNNTLKHAGATHVTVTLARVGKRVRMIVADNGTWAGSVQKPADGHATAGAAGAAG
ncbi:MAG TPA: PDZ domain-containing protein, partial [Chloroflexota bacterium]|nr:PDZ domain-containing protein [Chloroflexota bacterium]